MTDPSEYLYTTHKLKLPEIRKPLRYRLWGKRPQIFVLRSEHFNLKPKRWWHREDRNASRLALRVLEHNYDDYSREVSRRMGNFLLYGDSSPQRF